MNTLSEGVNGKQKSEVTEWLVQTVAQLAQKPVSQIDLETSFLGLGLSSLDVVQAVQEFKKWSGRDLSPTLFFEYPSIGELVSHLYTQSVEKETFKTRTTNFSNSPIAIVGMSCRFPQAASPEKFWQLLENGENAIRPIPKSRFSRELDFPAYAGLLEDVESFDPALFELSESEVKLMDPQQRLLMELAWEALEDSGRNPKKVSGSSTGVFIGISTNDYLAERIGEGGAGQVFDGTGLAHSIAANRLSYFFNFKGPSIALDTACSSSLVAIHQACQALRLGECEEALVGAVNIISTPYLMEAFKKANMLSPEGACRTFSDDANGYVRGEGAGMVVLKSLDSAIENGDEILAVIKSSAINQDGRTNSLTAPNGGAQVEVIKKALANSDLKIDEIDYIEAHGTGTPLGDPIEYSSLNTIYKDKKDPLYLGSVKTNIGHLEAAAGMAGLIKVIMAMKNNLLPKNLHFKKLNKNILKQEAPIQIMDQSKKWSKDEGPKRAGISSFGFGGTNAHLILEEAPKSKLGLKPLALEKDLPFHLIQLSHTSPEGVKAEAQNLKNFLQQQQEVSLLDLTNSLNKQKAILPFRSALIASSRENLLQQLETVTLNPKKVNKSWKKSAFVFTGQGSQYPKMGLEFYQLFPQFRDTFNHCLDLFSKELGTNLYEIWKSEATNELAPIYSTHYGQALIFSLEFALAKWLESQNIKPDSVTGHSLGEITAAAYAGYLSLEDAIKLVSERGKVMEAAPSGKMLIAPISRDRIDQILRDFNDKISLATLNAPNLYVLSGEEESIEKIHQLLTQEKIKSRLLPVNKAFHSHLMEGAKEEFVAKIQDIKAQKPKIDLVSALNGKKLVKEDMTPEYWGKHLREATDFISAANNLYKSGITHFIEIGPHPTLTHLLARTLSEKPIKLFSTFNRKESDTKSLLTCLEKLSLEGFSIALEKLTQDRGAKDLQLPSTAYNKKSFWLGQSNKKTQIVRKKKMSTTKSKEQYLSELKILLADKLELEPEMIEPDRQLMDFGADSLVLLNSLESINEKYNVQIEINDAFGELSTLNKVATFIAESNPSEEIFEEVELEAPSSKTIPTNDYTQSVIDRQLELMAQQLEVLKSAPSRKSTPALVVPQKKKRDTDLSGRGVLGNFQTGHGSAQESEKDSEKAKYLKNLVESFAKKTQKTKSHTQKFRTSLADNRVSAGFRPNLKEMVYPITFERAKDSKFWDLDGNEYLDFSMGFGVNLFGHSPSFIQKVLSEQLEKGMAVGPQSDMAGPVAELVCKLTGVERVAFVNSGTEAIMTAVRLARAASGRQKVVLFEGSYHGHFDGVLGRTNAKGHTVPVAPGIPGSLTEDLIVLDYLNEESLTLIDQMGDDIAAVLVEPIQSRFPEQRPEIFLKTLREITAKNDVALILDEVITGFRMAPGGMQKILGFEADLVTFGKVLGGGLPIGAIGGKSKFMDFIDGGKWQFGDNSMPPNKLTFFAGTFCKHPLAMAASYAVLTELAKNGEEIIRDLNSKTESMARELNIFFEEISAPLKIVYNASLFRFKFTGNMDWLFYELNKRGIYIWEGRNLFMATTHTQEEIQFFIDTVKAAVSDLVAIGHIPGKISSASKSERIEMDMIDAHKRFAELTLSEKLEDKLAAQVYVAMSLEGHLDFDKLEEAMKECFQRYDSLSANYDLENKKIQFGAKKCEIQVGRVDLSQLSDPQASLRNWMEETSKVVLDPNTTPLLIDLIKLGKDKSVISLVAHHLIVDGLSMAFMTDDIAKVYTEKVQGKPAKLRPAKTFSEFLTDYPERIERLSRSKEFWQEEAKKWTSDLFVPSANKSGGRLKTTLSPDEFKKVRMFGYKQKSSLLVTLLGSLYLALEKVTDKKSMTVGIPAAGHVSINDTMVGNCVNLVPLSYELKDGEELVEIVKNLRPYQLEVFAHSDYPISLATGKSPEDIMQVSLNVEPVSELPEFSDLKADLVHYPIQSSEYPIMINAMKLNGTLQIELDYQENVLNKDQAQSLLSGIQQALADL